jgi:hypothetical protein
MLAFYARQKYLCLFLAALMLLQAMPGILLAADESIAVEKVHFEITGDLVRVYYDLIGPIDRVHSVSVVLQKESDPSFIYRPVNLTGDVGTIVFPGERRRITWDFTKEFPEGLSGNDYYFVVNAELVEQEGMSPMVWVGGGAALVGGIVAIVLLSKGEDTQPPPPAGFPTPPGRPTQ